MQWKLFVTRKVQQINGDNKVYQRLHHGYIYHKTKLYTHGYCSINVYWITPCMSTKQMWLEVDQFFKYNSNPCTIAGTYYNWISMVKKQPAITKCQTLKCVLIELQSGTTIKVPNQPENHDQILLYIRKGAQIKYIERLGDHYVLFSCTYFICSHFLSRLSVRTRFMTYITSTRWLKKRGILRNTIGFCVWGKTSKNIATNSCKA